MPIYEYKCEKCNKVFEELKSVSEDYKNTICECGNKAYKIISSNTSFILKGKGWASEGYSKDKE